MAKYQLRIHIRVMNRGQWDILDDLLFSDEVENLIGDFSSYIDGRSLIINKTVTYNGVLFVNPFLEIIEVIRCNIGDCLVIGDYVDQANKSMAAYVCEVGEISESETSVSAKLLAADISDMEAWMKARGKTTPQSAISTIKAFYGAEPQPTMQGPWSIEKEIELRHNVFSKATFDEIVEIAKANLERVHNVFGDNEETSKTAMLAMILAAGKAGAANGRKVNSDEKNLFKAMILGMPTELVDQLVAGFEGAFDNDSLESLQNTVDTIPQLAPTILDIAFCFMYADGRATKNDIANIKKLSSILSMPMSAIYMVMQFGEDIPNPPVDYVAYVSGVDNDTVAYMAGGDGFMTVNFDGQNMGVRMISADMSENIEEPELEEVRGDVEDKADELIEEWSHQLELLNISWKQILRDRQEAYEGSTFYSPEDVVKAINKILKEQQKLIDKYGELFREIDKKGNNLVNKGLIRDYINRIYELLNEVIDGAEAVGVDYNAHGSYNGEIASVNVVWSDGAKETVKDWKNKKPKPKSKSALSKVKNASKNAESVEDPEKCRDLIKELKQLYKTETLGKIGAKKITEYITALEKKVEELSALKKQFSDINKELTETNERMETLKSQISNLKNERSTLGFFAFKRKKEIDGALPAMEEEVNVLLKKATELTKKKKGYKTLKAISDDIEDIITQIQAYKEALDISTISDKKNKIIAELKQSKIGNSLLKEYDVLRTISAGKYIKFGKFRQNGTEDRPIEWQVLEANEGKILVLSRYAIYARSYNDEDDCRWENSAIRKWLNTKFYTQAFSDEEKSMILTETVTAEYNPEYDTDPGNDTKDKLFLLSISEVDKYLKSYKDRKCTPTSYALSAQKTLSMDAGYCYWWLRTPGSARFNPSAVEVNPNGMIIKQGAYVGFIDTAAIRPAMWIDVNA